MATISLKHLAQCDTWTVLLDHDEGQEEISVQGTRTQTGVQFKVIGSRDYRGSLTLSSTKDSSDLTGEYALSVIGEKAASPHFSGRIHRFSAVTGQKNTFLLSPAGFADKRTWTLTNKSSK